MNNTQTATQHATDTDVPSGATGPRWRRALGLQFLGPVQGSGLRDPAYLVRRIDDQVVQLSELLHLVVVHAEPPRSSAEVADAVSAAYGRTLTVEGVEHLITTRLEPLGLVVEDEAGEPLRPVKARPLLALTLKATLLPARRTRVLAALLAPLFWPPVVLAALAALVASDVLLVTGGGFWQAISEVFATPTAALLIYGMLVAAAVVHELGHAAACRYGGADPGEIGVGVYLVFPAFYTDVTDSYRLGRAGRVRTDLGGLYFNVLTVLGLVAGYLATDSGLLLLTALGLQLQMLQQLIPVVRFDGYFILSDLAGVPDLFSRVGPVLRSLRPGHPVDPRVSELRPRARRFVTTWVVLVVPLLAGAIVWFVWVLPQFVDHGREGIRLQQLVFDLAWQQRDWPAMALAVFSITLLLVPLVGASVVLWRLATTLSTLVRRHVAARMRTEERRMDTFDEPPETERAVLSAADFTDAIMYAPRVPPPRQGWRRAVYEGSGHVVNPGPSPTEQRRQELERRLRTPIEGSRRVVVLSRKGGVGKTTISLALGSTFAMLRGDRVIAVDANPDAGNLAHRVAPPHDMNITHVLRDLDDITSYAALRGYTSQAIESRLEVLASDDDPRIQMALDRDDYHRLVGLLDHFYNLILLDTGTGILDSANQGLLSEADQIVLVVRSGLDGGRAGALTLDWMDEHGFGDLVSRAVVVVNAQRHGYAPPDLMRRHFEKRCQRVVTVPWDGALEQGALTDMSSLHRKTRDSLVDIAAAVADNFVRMEARP
ncbi:putative peptide zinc metalloprotease protein [Nocardioides sp. BE266]|uniref:MinD/ParA family protein n=1 Tax=Nocardioides sp. BE266 TaxID=2817725 RepID=UPI002862A4C3|nr:MinD/ParA family protein [Nocardioides sp. BE266]MDR7253269.1 putative peptide zinc metalloprotease protein [Nocardioides sp. BE266]